MHGSSSVRLQQLSTEGLVTALMICGRSQHQLWVICHHCKGTAVHSWSMHAFCTRLLEHALLGKGPATANMLDQTLGLPLGLEAPVMTPNGVTFLFFLLDQMAALLCMVSPADCLVQTGMRARYRVAPTCQSTSW